MPNPPSPPEALPYLPVFLDVRGRKVVLVGGTEATASKARLTVRAGAAAVVVAESLSPDLAALVREGSVVWHRDPFRPDLLDGAVIVIDGSGDAALTTSVRAAAQARGIPCNVVDVPERCDFIVPAILDRAPVVVAVSTGGAAPALARTIRQRLETAIPAGYGRLARAAQACRQRVKDALPTARARQRFWDGVLTGDIADTLMALPEAAAVARIEAELARFAAAPADEGSVTLVGAGPGDPGLLTLHAAKAIETADVILHDALVPTAILGLARRETRLVPVGKRKGRPSVAQAFTNRMMAACAARGLRVVRLKAGDPFVFGRGGEEADYLRAKGIPVRVLPGITAAVGAAAEMGLPLTHRGVARSVRFVTAQCRTEAETAAMDWRALADAATTLAIYMGRDRMAEIAGRLMAAGLPGDTPMAVAENACRPEAAHHFGTAAAFAACGGEGMGSGPAILFVGDAVGAAPGWQAACAQVTVSPRAAKMARAARVASGVGVGVAASG